ncbi:MAG: hypothetical protein KC455_02705 [Carnobacterium sp.]|nr:hypothetical protein [Carnobacterium sp.]
MPLQNSYVYTQTIIDSDKLLTNTKNTFRYVSQRPYQSKKNPEETGVSVTLLVLYDSTDYGTDKKTGMPRESNVFNSFDVTILNKKSYLDLKKGDTVSLAGFIPEKSFAIGFDLLLRFREIKKVQTDEK